MALIQKKEKVKKVPRKVNLNEAINQELKDYIKFLGMDETKTEENEATDYIINEALKYIFNKDKDFRKFCDEKEKMEKEFMKEVGTTPIFEGDPMPGESAV